MFRLRYSVFISLAASSGNFFQVAAVGQAANKTALSPSAFIVSGTGAVRSASGNGRVNPVIVHAEGKQTMAVDVEYPGTAVQRMMAVRQRVKELTPDDLSQDWASVRRKLLWAGGLRDLPDAIPGQGYTGHSFNDYNHVDLTCMAENVASNENDGKVYREIARGNQLGPGIRIASLPELGPGGSWSTCLNGCNLDPPQDVAHIQFRSRIAFKLVWCPTNQFNTFVLVDDDGDELARGTPSNIDGLPNLRQRQMNYRAVQGSKYAVAADAIAAAAAAAATATDK